MTGDGGRRRVRLTPPPRVGPVGRRPPRSPAAHGGSPRARRRPRWPLVAAAVLLPVLLGFGVYLLLTAGASPEPPAGSGEPPAEVEAAAGPPVAEALPGPVEDPEGAPGAAAPAAREPAPAPAVAAPVPPAARPGGAEYGRAMSEGLAALERSEWAAARAAFERAAELDPEASAPGDGLARAAAGVALARIEELRGRAQAHEEAEEWEAAATAYEAVLDREPAATFAREGRLRAGERAELARRIEFHLANPLRLSTEEVLEEARDLLELAAESRPAGPRHRRQLEALEELVAAAATPVRVALLSDGETEVVIHQVGRLGSFTRRELELRPGSYIVVGRRPGYRDVRRRLLVEAGKSPEPLLVRCEEEV